MDGSWVEVASPISQPTTAVLREAATTVKPPAVTWNVTAPLEDLPLDSNFAWLLCALFLSMSWVVYITYYNSRLIGFIVTKILNRFHKTGYIKIGSLSISVLTGKILFRDVAYITEDFTVRTQDGWVIFRWWIPYVKKCPKEDFSHSETRLSILLNGFELHAYNRSKLYAKLEHLFGLDPKILPGSEEAFFQDSGEADTQTALVDSQPQEDGYDWRDLIPVIKIDIATGRLMFGNRLLPTTLSISFEEAHLVYTSKPAPSLLDNFTHIAKCKAENFKVLFAPSPKYTGVSDEPPRYMGEGFVILQSNYVDLYYYQDEPGNVHAEPETVELANGDVVQRTTAPLWGLDVKCGKGTDFSYGPWADRQREHLFKFFFPPDYQALVPTKEPKLGEKRSVQSFDIRLSLLADATIDILFSKEKETNAIHMNIGPGSYMEITIPWVVQEQGCSTRINGQLLHVEASTSLQYRSLVDSETLQFDIQISYPRVWNEEQVWTCNLTGCKATVNLIYANKEFFNSLIEDWGSKHRPDLLHFVPYTWRFSLILKEFELILVTNEHNWIDCSSQLQENALLSISGDLFDLSFDLPFVEFLPQIVKFKFWIQGECVSAWMYMPEGNSNRTTLSIVDKCAKLTNRDGTIRQEQINEKKWSNIVNKSSGWIECWEVPIVALSITYTFHPSPPLGSKWIHQLDITTPEREELLLSPIRPCSGVSGSRFTIADFNPLSLDPDLLQVDLEVGPSVLRLYGSFLSLLINLKDNYFGEYQTFLDFDSSPPQSNGISASPKEAETREFDHRQYRTLEVKVAVTLHDIQGHIMKECRPEDPPCPCLHMERMGFEMYKTYQETKLQLLFSPLVLSISDHVFRPESNKYLQGGHLALSALQVRGHAMFSNAGRTLDQETLEYAWLVEIQLGDITSRLTSFQLFYLVSAVENFIFQLQQTDSSLQPSHPYKQCQHSLQQHTCSEGTDSLPCPCPEDVKYRMTRISLDALDLCLVETGTAIEIEVVPVRLALCNLHGKENSTGVSALVHQCVVRQYILAGSGLDHSHMPYTDTWLEVGKVCFGPIFVDNVVFGHRSDMHSLQNASLKKHDEKTKRLWFLWPVETNIAPQELSGKCGCVGGCAFFGNNRNGACFFRLPGPTEDSYNCSARFCILTDEDFGFGQSLLHEGEFIFDVVGQTSNSEVPTPGSGLQGSFTFTEGYLNRPYQKTPNLSPKRHSDSSIGPAPREIIEEVSEVHRPSFISRSVDRKHSSGALQGSQDELMALPEGGGRRMFRQFSSPGHSCSTLLAPPDGTVDAQLMRKGSGSGRRRERGSADSGLKRHPGSHQSLTDCENLVAATSSLPGRGISPNSVRRAVSTESTHSSEAYYSADEESSLSSSTTTDDRDMTVIEADRLKPHTQKSNGSIDRKLLSGTRQTLHDIDEQPVQCEAEMGSDTSSLQRSLSNGTHDQSESNSVSSTSFISAVSSQEDVALVDLHNQMDKPILESPLLMSCYTAHMSQLQCFQWNEPPPLPHLTQQEGIPQGMPNRDQLFHCSASKWKPKFVTITEGFTAIRMVDKSKGATQSWEKKTCPEREFVPGILQTHHRKKGEEESPDDKVCAKSIVVVKVKGDVDIVVSPLMLESMKSFVEALESLVTTLHPLTIVNHLHWLSVNKVEGQNQLKKEKLLYLCQLQNETLLKARKKNSSRKSITSNTDSTSSTANYEEIKKGHLQGFLDISTINFSIMQASVVEEIISFAALDNVKDLTCASVLATRIDSIVFQLSLRKESRRSLQTFIQHGAEVKLNRKASERKKNKTDSLPSELVTVEREDVGLRELAISASIKRVHVQLRRLKNSSSVLKDAVLTVIPFHRSSVGFTYEKVFLNLLPRSADGVFLDRDWDQKLDEEKMGFIMFECGTEDLAVKLMNCKCSLPDSGTFSVDGKDVTPSPKQEQPDSGMGGSNLPASKSKSDGSWDAKNSFPSTFSECSNTTFSSDAKKKEGPAGNSSSFIVELKMVWFNFAAPPHTPNTRRIDFTRLDWHLLSTATPSLNSWLKACNRFHVALSRVCKATNKRVCAVMGCLMAEALERNDIHMPIKAKYLTSKLTPIAKTLQEDPSCQLLMVLKRFLRSTELTAIEENLNPENIPPTEILHRGIIALSRQWKNIVYVPDLVEHNYRLQKGINSYSVPYNLTTRTAPEDLDKVFLDECEVTDETTNLLMAEGGSIFVKPDSANPMPGQDNTAVKSSSTPDVNSFNQDNLSGKQQGKGMKRKLPSYPPRSSRASVAFPLLGGPLESPARYGNLMTKPSGFAAPPPHHTKGKKHDSHHSLKSTTWSFSSIEPNIPPSILDTPKKVFDLERHAADEDLYNWMARQQSSEQPTGDYGVPNILQHLEQESKNNTTTSENSYEGRGQTGSVFPLGPISLGLHMADASMIFKNLLSNLGIPDNFSPSLMEQLGCKVSGSVVVELLRMDIVESEYTGIGSKQKKKVPRNPYNIHSKLYIDTSMDTPAFVCDKFSLEVELTETANEDILKKTNIQLPAGGPLFPTTLINFHLNTNYIAQQVNMPLLRLIHQCTTMYENLKDVQSELKANRPRSFKAVGKDAAMKQSPSVTESNVESLRPQSPQLDHLESKGKIEGSGAKHPPSLSQKLRNTCNTKGYVNLEEATTERTYSPLSLAISESVTIDIQPSEEHPATEESVEKPFQPRCWRTMIYLLDLYETMPETKTVKHRSELLNLQSGKLADVSEGYKGNGKYEPLKEHKIDMGEPPSPNEKYLWSDKSRKQPMIAVSKSQIKGISKNLITLDQVPQIIFGVARIRRIKLLATLSGLKLEAELGGLHASLTHRQRLRGHKRWSESSLTGQLGQTTISVLEGIPPNVGIVVKITVGKSQSLYSTVNRSGKGHNSGLLTIGPVDIDIPQHPVALHGMMTRSSRQLSTTLQELRYSRQPSRSSRQMEDPGSFHTQSKETYTTQRVYDRPQLLTPIVIQFSIILDSVTVGASLLPSLRAQYQMGQMTSMGITGSKAKFTVDLPKHTISFNTKVSMESNVPSSASVDLPPVHISAEYIQDPNTGLNNKGDSFTDGVVLRQGSYLNFLTEIGAFEHSLTTDLLNHLVLVQKVFMKEVNEVLQKMSGGDKLVPLWNEEEKTPSLATKRLLFSVELRLKGIQITATTPTSSALRLETGSVELQLSNRVQNMSVGSSSGNMKLFGKAQVDVNLSLGQLIKNALFEEAEPEFQQFAYFKTRICMRNALQDEMISSQSEDKEAVLITLNRPLIYIQPIALDKAVLVWLNYKNAYEYWNEQRFSTNKEDLIPTQQLLERVPQLAQLGSQSLGTLFLQLTVDDMGICLPLSPYPGTIGGSKTYDSERRAAVVVTLENTRVSACSCGSLVSKARFTGLCLRFADDFETSLDDWKPDPMDPSIMNLCVVSEGTYEICSQTLAPQPNAAQPSNAKWILNVQWQMEGVDIHMDTNIGKQLSALFKTLTALTGEEDDADEVDEGNQPSQKGHPEKESVGARKCSVYVESLPPYLQDPSLDSKRRSRLIEKEMNEQARIINDLRLLGASQSTIEQEMRRLQELEAAVFNDFRRDVIKRLRRQSVKATSFRDKLGLGNRAVGTPHQTKSLFFPEDAKSKMAFLNMDQMGSSQESSPTHSHTRTGSLDIADFPNMEPDKRLGVHRELSLDSVFTTGINIPDTTISETSTPSNDIDSSPKMPQHDPLPTSPSTVSSEAATENDFPLLRVVDDKKKVFTSPGHYKLAVPEPSIDFELDVKVVFNSGKCVLHTKEASKDEEQSSKRSMKKERSFSGGLFDSSPSHSKKRHGSGLRLNTSAARLRYLQAPLAGQIADFTILLIPGLDIKVHYNSKTVSGESPISSGICSLKPSTHNLQQEMDRSQFVSFEPSHGQQGLRRTTGVKKASLFAWMTLQSIPEEAVVSPHILDFLEQALEPIPLQPTKPSATSTDVSNTMFSNINREPSGGAMATPSQYAYASFPVDVIVYFRMQPSIVRFSCLPISRVECLLRLPSVELVFSSKRAEGDHVAIVESAPLPRWSVGSEHKLGRSSLDESMHQTATGGLSMTGSMADFSLYIFHPYGGAKKTSAGTAPPPGTSSGGGKENSETLSNSERKGSLSLQVEFVKVNISRSRKMSRLEAGQKGMRLNEPGAAVIRFSAVCDIGSASFKYDMRRLTEILAFPKAWYRRSIARRMFLGDQSSTSLYSDLEDSLDTSSSSGTLSPSISKSDYFGPSGPPPAEPPRIFPAFPEEEDSNQLHSDSVFHTIQPTSRERLRLNFQEPLTKIRTYDQFGDKQQNSSPAHAEKPSSAAWETLVLFAVNLSKLSIHMNMGNVMGNTTWLTRDFKSQGRLSIGSNGHKNLFVSLGLEGSSLDSKGGIVGGTIELSQIETSMYLKEDWNQQPDHTVAINLSALESRLDYMGTSVLMGRVSSFNTTLKDEWQISSHGDDKTLADHPTKRPALIFVHGDLGWDQMQLLISKSTTSDIMKMCAKLEEFFSQQFHSSKRVFSSLQPHNFQYRTTKPRPQRQRSAEGPVLESEARHHRHWQNVLKQISGLQLSTMPFCLPRHGTILGGTMDLHGKNISLACFHGINFRSKSWAIFSLRDPNISFATEAQDITSTGSIDTHIVQNLSFGLGQSNSEHLQHASMATVCRISRNVFFPPQFRTMHEWFHYAFSSSEIDDVSRFPELEHEKEGLSPSERRASLPLKGPEFSHNMEVIFALPSMQLHLKTEHLQSNSTPTLNDSKPTVECSFVTEFDDHIFVSVDAEAFYFLHDLITAYLKEKDSSFVKSQSPDSDWKRKVADPTETLQKDWRNYACHTWHLEPTVRLLSWAGKGIEPYGVDYILQKLGFAHARVTIPKWMQRGCMDPLDKILSVVMRQMISAVRNDGEEKIAAERAAKDNAIMKV